MDNGHFLSVRWYDEQRSTIRQSKLNSLVLKSIEQWCLTGGARPPEGVKKFQEGREPLCAIQHGKFDH